MAAFIAFIASALRRLPPIAPFCLGALLAAYRPPGAPGVVLVAIPAVLVAIGIATAGAFLAMGRRTDVRALVVTAAALALGLRYGAWAHGRAESRAAPPCLGLPAQARPESLVGIIATDPRRTASGFWGFDVELSEALGRDGALASAAGRVSVYARTAREGLARGQAVSLPLGRGLSLPRAGQGAWADALALPVAFIDSVEILAPAPPIEAARAAARAALLGALRRAGGPTAGPLLEALIVGVRDDLDAELSAGFRKAGCAHILALSGQHVGVLAALVALLLGRLVGPYRARAGACLLAAFYLWLVGASPSVARAVIMFWLSSAFLALDRPQGGLAVLAWTFVLAVGLDPASIHGLSFKLSYLAVAGIAGLGSAYEFALRRWLPPPASGAVAAGFAALAATAPLSALAFGTLNPLSPLWSAIAGPLVTALMWGGLGGAALVGLARALAGAAVAIGATLAGGGPSLACAVACGRIEDSLALACSIAVSLPYRAIAALMEVAAYLPSLALPEGEEGARLALAASVALLAAFVYAWPHVALLAQRTLSRQLRRSLGTRGPARRARPRDAQEVRPELPSVRAGQAPHRRALRDGNRGARLGDRPGHRRDDARGATQGPGGIGLRDR